MEDLTFEGRSGGFGEVVTTEKVDRPENRPPKPIVVQADHSTSADDSSAFVDTSADIKSMLGGSPTHEPIRVDNKKKPVKVHHAENLPPVDPFMVSSFPVEEVDEGGFVDTMADIREALK